VQTIKLNLEIYHRRFNFGQAVDGVRRLLLALREAHPELAYWEMLGKTRFKALQHDLADLDDQLRAAARPGKKDKDVTALDADGNLTSDSTRKTGFSFELYSATRDAGGGLDYSRPDHVALRFDLGVDDFPAMVSMTFPAEGKAFFEGGAMRAIVEAAIRALDPDVLEVWPADFFRAAVSDHQLPRRVRAGWFNYLRHPLVVPCLPDALPYAATRLGEDRVLLSLGDKLPEPGDAALVARAAAMQAIFDRYHLNEWHVIAGLPLDADEQDYVRQVTGAPPDRGYAVAFTMFDGYDAARGVLLYARLFKAILRGQRFDLHPATRGDRNLIGGLFFVVLAQQQLAALDHVKAGNPIEWHVGDAELARTLQLLLNDWLQIPRTRLSVHHTPRVTNGAR